MSGDFWVDVINGVIAFALGGFVAVGELVSRYRDDPLRAVMSVPAALYVALNGLASVAAFALIRRMDWTFGAPEASVVVWQVLVAGFGAIALFRTSLFNVTVGDQVIGVGPSVVLNVILTAADREVDRKRAIYRIDSVAEVMRRFPFEQADALRLVCFEAMQNASPADRDAVSNVVRDLRDPLNASVPDHVKSFVLGLSLMTLVGETALRRAVRAVSPADSSVTA